MSSKKQFILVFIVIILSLIVSTATAIAEGSLRPAFEDEKYMASLQTQFIPEKIKLRDCPAGLNEENHSRLITQIINNSFHKWKEFDLGDTGEFCILLVAPEYRRLTAQEAKKLLLASNAWIEQAAHVNCAADSKKEQVMEAKNAAGSQENNQDHETYKDYLVAGDLIGDDERERVPNHECRTYPYNTIGNISTNIWQFGGTGFLISPHAILTNAHVIYKNERGGFIDFKFSPGQYVDLIPKRPYGSRDQADIVRYDIHPKYIEVYKERYYSEMAKYDLAVFYINEPFQGISTFMPLKFSFEPDGQEVYTSGYPGSLDRFLSSPINYAQHRTSGVAIDSEDLETDETGSLFDYILAHTADATGGQSGSPIWTGVGARRFVVALQTVGNNESNGIEFYAGTRLTANNQSLIEQWKKWEPVKSVNLTVSPTSPTAPGEEITFTARAEGGVDPEYQFYFKFKEAKDWIIIQPYSRDNTYRVSPNVQGSYDIGVIARSSGSNQGIDAYEIVEHAVEVEPIRSVTLNVTPSSPTTPGERITLTAHATGGDNPEYRFGYRRVGSSKWSEARGYSPNNTKSATPGTKLVGEFEFIVLARSTGSDSAYDELDIKTHTVKKDSDENDPKFLPWPKTPGSSSSPGPVITSLNPLLEWYSSPDDPTIPDYLPTDIVRISEYPYGRNNVVYEGHAYRFNNSTLRVPSGILESGKRYCWSVTKWGGAMTFSECLYFQTR